MIVEQTPVLIALDWGTSSLRAFLVAADGAVLERRAAQRGILNVPDGDFAATFAEFVGPWRAQHPALPAITSGMIGSRQGWREVPYVEAPAGLDALARGLALVEGGQFSIVPGVMLRAGASPPDVMRGEETQIFGSLAACAPDEAGVFILPGTHSKWALVEAGRIVWFATFMTGEVYGVLKAHSILGRQMEGEADDADSFRRGASHAFDQSATLGGLLHKLFSTRTLGLFGALPARGTAAYLSGLLIGSELDEALPAITAWLGRPPSRVGVIGEESLARRYVEALSMHAIEAVPAAADAVALGLLRIARAAHLVKD
jgi:2-dehydro-3-deoxygalactonokinase